MRNFKIIYYVIYALFTGLVFYLAANLISVIDTLKDWGWYTYLSELPDIGSKFFYFTGVFLILSIAIETYFTFEKRNERRKMEKEILSLKAKLYDQGIAFRETPETTAIEEPDHNVAIDTGDTSDDSPTLPEDEEEDDKKF